MTGFATITSKYQLDLPVALARLSGLTPGDRVLIRAEEKKITIEDVGDFADLKGTLANHPISRKYSVLKIIELAKRREAKRIADEA